MKVIIFALMLIIGSDAFAKEINFTASTPAGKEVRDFLGISLKDSIDFIRWQLSIIDDKSFELECKYGISRPNTNGFIDEKSVRWHGATEFAGGRVILKHGTKSVSLQLLNPNIMHLLNKDGTMMIGNAGWSYTLNAMQQTPTQEIKLNSFKTHFEDSVVFVGRTPCRGMEELMIGKTRPDCYKKKWMISMYKDNPKAKTGTYRIGTTQSRNGKWTLKNDKAGNIIYSLDLNNGNTMDLLQTDENIVYIMDPKGGVMVGDHDFSYSLNRKTGAGNY
jgi:hypothetical protein